MSILTPSGIETFDYGAPGWSSIETTNWQRVNGYLNKLWVLQTADASANDKFIKYNSTTGKWEISNFTAADVSDAITHKSRIDNPHGVTKVQVGLGNVENIKNNNSAVVAPTVSDDNVAGYSIGSRWVNTLTDKEYVATDVNTGAALWVETTGAGSGASTFLGLIDTPDSYVDQIGKYARVNAAGTALEFDTPSGSGDMTKLVYDTDNDGIVDKSETIDDGAGNSATAVAVKNAVLDAHTHTNKSLIDTYTQTDTNIANAIGKAHTQNTDQYLDYGGTNQVIVTDVKSAVTNTHAHANKALLDTYTQTNADIADAVTKRHIQNTDTQLKSGVVSVDTSNNLNVTGFTNIKGIKSDGEAGFVLQTKTGVVGTTAINWKLGNKYKFAFAAGNETLSFTDPSGACNLILMIIQDSVGGRTITWPSGIKWCGGTGPTLSTAANAIDILAFFFDGVTYYGQISKDFR